MAQDTLYFPHDYNPFLDFKVRKLVKKHGAVGYGVYWRMVEYLHSESSHKIYFNSGVGEAIADDLGVTPNQIDEIFNTLIDDCLLLETDGEKFWSKRVFENIEKRKDVSKQRSLAGHASAEARRKLKEMADKLNLLIPNSEHPLTDVEQPLTDVD